ncbi:hypothetical protein [Robiginitalea aurantiaca]|uniref:Uncharacterized protein n=1 Tax=Robiginitalea aurantiaca TaxID=3056915 RepID=A0ABT7WEW1_9FLAO|nr:hypothetical protein [Robiginitalea aurantiaca]MDM9631458.1 hypothetical protein [Robiginitalea aurantiaca]
MTTKKLLQGSFSVFTLLLLIVVATVVFALPFLLLDYYFNLEVAFLAYIMVAFISLVYLFIRYRKDKSLNRT